MTYPLTRKEAIFRGMTLYKTGIPCKHGHVGKRYVLGDRCVKCVAKYQHDRNKLTAKRNRLRRQQERETSMREADRHFKLHHKEIARAVAEGRYCYGKILP